MTGTKKIKIRHLITLSFLAISTLFVVSCNFSDDSDDSKNTARQENTVTIHGTFTLQGAVPSSLRSAASRSAVPSLPEGVSFSVTAKSSKEETMTASYISSDGQFEIKLTQGEWTLSAEIKKDGTTILSGKSDKISITAEKPIYDEIFIIVKPDSSTGSGTVNLPVNIENTSRIKTAQISWRASSGTTGTQTLDFSSNPSAVFTMGGTDISSGAYTAVFQFFSSEADGKRLLYQCTETVNVCANLCTDSWVKNGTASSPWLTESDGKATFTVTKSLVEKFAQTSFFVQGTGGTYTPKTSASDTNNGTYFDPLSTVQKAVDNIIQINDETTEYSIFIDGTVTAPDDLDSLVTPNFIKIKPQKKLNLTIASISSSQAVINANTKAGVIDVVGKSETEKTTLVLQNVCITGGKTQTDGVGGGLKAQYADITLKAGTVIGTKLLPEENGNSSIASSSTYSNYAVKGGGIYINGCTLAIEDDVYICQNYSENEGGGIAAEGNSTIIATGGIIGFNQASSGGVGGGGIYIKGGSAELTDCTVCLNKAGGNGGGIYIEGTSLTLNAGTVVGNKNASKTAINLACSNYANNLGGGIYAKNTNVTMNEGSCVMYNYAHNSSGGGLYVENGSLTVTNAKINYNYSTFTGKTGSGGALKLAGTASMTINGDESEIAYNGSLYKGAGIELTETSSCTMNAGSIHDNINNNRSDEGFGVGVCIASGTTFTMTGGKIYGNMYKNVTVHKFADAIYVGGKLNLSGNAYIAPDNDVYLASGNFVTVTGELTGESAVATVTPDSYTEDRVIVKGSDSYNLSSSDCSKFAVTKDSVNNKFYSVFLDASSNTGILKESKIAVSPELPGIRFIPSKNFILSSLLQSSEQTISFAVQKKVVSEDGETVEYIDCNPSELSDCCIALLQSGSEILSGTETLTLKTWLPEGTYNLYMTATVDGVEYSAWEPFSITSQIPISSLLSAPDARYCPYLAAETGEDLKKLDEWMRNGSTMEGITITLTDNIDLTSETEWQPIGYTGDSGSNLSENNGTSFKGTLDGNGKSIKLQVAAKQRMIGLVQKNDGIIENLVVEQYTEEEAQLGDDTARGSRGGAFCGINNGIIRNCVNKAGLKSYTYWGIAGICYINKGTIENCLNTGTIEITTPASELWAGAWIYNAGIAAENYGSIRNCVNAGKILTMELATASNYVNYFTGTVAGRMYDDAVISNCYWLKNSLIRGGTGGNECVTFVVQDIIYQGESIHVDSIPDPSKITGCGYFESFTASAPLTAGDEVSCKSSQELSYGQTFIDALNGYVNANPDKELKQWQTAANGTITLSF